MDLDVAETVSSGDVHRQLPAGVQAGKQDIVRAQRSPGELIQEDDAGLLDVFGELRVIENGAALHEAVHAEKSRDGVNHRSHVVDVHLHAELPGNEQHQFSLPATGRAREHRRRLGKDVPDKEIPVGLPYKETVLVNLGYGVPFVRTDLVQERELLRGCRGVPSGEEGLRRFLLGDLLIVGVGVQHLPGRGREVEVVVGVPLQDGIDVPGTVVRGSGTGAQFAHRRAEHRPDGVSLPKLHATGGHLRVEFLDDGRSVGRGLERKRIETVAGAVTNGLEEVVFHGMKGLCPAGCCIFANGFWLLEEGFLPPKGEKRCKKDNRLYPSRQGLLKKYAPGRRKIFLTFIGGKGRGIMPTKLLLNIWRPRTQQKRIQFGCVFECIASYLERHSATTFEVAANYFAFWKPASSKEYR